MQPSTDLLPLNFEGQQIRISSRDGSAWFVAADICRALDLRGDPGQHTRRLDADEKGLISIQTPGGAQQVAIVSEPGAYRLIFASRKLEADRFKRWLAHDVIPAIRKTGMYVAPGGGEISTLTSEVRREIGGIVKSVVGKALEDIVESQLMIAQGLAALKERVDGLPVEAAASMDVPGMVSAYHVLGMAEVQMGKRYHGLYGWVSKEIRDYCGLGGYRMRIVDLEPGKRWEFDREAAIAWLDAGGRADIWRRVGDYWDRKNGQGVIRFPNKDRQEPAQPTA